MALPTNGRVIIETTSGEIDMELWSKECPKTCRNFLQLAMEGYYDGVIFHRVVPGFLVQTGDKTGTGNGGESIWGEPFEDEIHPRLRWSHRGLVGMANNGTKNSNDSQFIVTLDRADELHGKHTLFGRCMGDTIYNVMKIAECELEIKGSGRPVYPPKIKTIRIIENPFNDIVPRITAAEKRAQKKAKADRQKERESEERRKGAKKDVNLLSFEDEEESNGETFLKKAIYRPDLAETEQSLSGVVPESMLAPALSSKAQNPQPSSTSVLDSNSTNPKEQDITQIRAKHLKEKAAVTYTRQEEIDKLEKDIRALSKRHGNGSEDDEPHSKKPKISYLQAELAKYNNGNKKFSSSKKGKGKRVKDESDVLAALDMFRGKLKGTNTNGNADRGGDEVIGDDQDGRGVGEGGVEIDDDTRFLSHALRFAKDDGEEGRKAERDYEVIDPRKRSDQAKAEERDRKNAAKAKVARAARGGRR